MNQEEQDKQFLREAIALAKQGMNHDDGGPFGAVVVKDGVVVGRGHNLVTSTNDPTAHAEVTAIRDACKNLGSFQLNDCTLYSSCEPCPMCFGAIYWARPKRLVYACTRTDAADIGFDDDFIYRELELDIDQRSIETNQLLQDEGLGVMKLWTQKTDRKDY